MPIITEAGQSGVIYYAVGEKYVREACDSARSVRAAMPDLPIALFTNDPVPDGVFDERFDLDPRLGVKTQKIASLKRSPFAKTLYLDTDTYMVAEVPELFEILDDFEIAFSLSSIGSLPPGYDDVPSCVPMPNSGVLAFRRCEQVTALLDAWLSLHGNGDDYDQPPLRQALYRGRVRSMALGNRYNFKITFPQVTRKHEVKILHGHHPDLASIAKEVQSIDVTSCVLPVGFVHRTRLIGRKSHGVRLSEWITESYRLLRRKGRPG